MDMKVEFFNRYSADVEKTENWDRIHTLLVLISEKLFEGKLPTTLDYLKLHTEWKVEHHSRQQWRG